MNIDLEFHLNNIQIRVETHRFQARIKIVDWSKLSELEEPDEQPIEVSDDENEPIQPKKINKNLIKPQ